MDQQLRALSVLPEDLSSSSSAHMVFHNCALTPVPGDPTPGMHMVHRHIFRQNTHTKNFKNTKNNYSRARHGGVRL